MRTLSSHPLHTKNPSIHKMPPSGPAMAVDTYSRVAGSPRTDAATSVVIIERHSFVRGCIQSMLSQGAPLDCVGVATVDDYLSRAGTAKGDVIVLCAIGLGAREADMQLSLLMEAQCRAPIVVMSDLEDPDLLVTVMDKGVNGFMPADISLEVAAHALRLVAAGGQYFPADTLLAARKAIDGASTSEAAGKGMFTRRQVAVIDALRRGKANKVIAYELNVCESTVKVHVRNIMKKLKAKNRTEVAYLANGLLPEPRL
ncbi:response regulator transcription factor [Hyphomicrobium sp. CS1GBMeth3]|uniref:response regulator transcription factor n=1 Tax=Hyphomicrobium sp. CS1GBMeth3 TaxID=1892845 RepID=UPI000A7FA4B0|nr:response regulator transcription factor [Hyphomicrobium sp. CS1GBMeth3]